MATDDDDDDDYEHHHNDCYLQMQIQACGRRMYAVIITLNCNMGLRPQNDDGDDGNMGLEPSMIEPGTVEQIYV